MHYPQPTFRSMGDSAILVELGDGIDPQVNDRLWALMLELQALALPGIRELVPAYRSLMLLYDPLRMRPPQIQRKVTQILAGIDPALLPAPQTLEIPVVYGGQHGPDLPWVAEFHGLSQERIARLHAGERYRVFMIGFTPGYPYMGELPPELITPRRDTPRTRVPKGSVGIAQSQTGIYPVESPGGWQIIGRTPISLFDPVKQPPAVLHMGDRVKFYPISVEEFNQWEV